MTDSEMFYEFIVVMVELTAFVAYLSVGAVISEVIVPRLVVIIKRIASWFSNFEIGKRIKSSIKVQSG